MKLLDYNYRPDGNYLIRKTCTHCGEPFEVHAMQGMKMDATDNLCQACCAVYAMERGGRHAE